MVAESGEVLTKSKRVEDIQRRFEGVRSRISTLGVGGVTSTSIVTKGETEEEAGRIAKLEGQLEIRGREI